MKRIRALDRPTPGLVDYLDCEGAHVNWDGFRSHQAGAAYREIITALCSIQHGLCGYCEIDITKQHRQVEHVIPRSDARQGRDRALDPANLMACCKGGTGITEDTARRSTPVKRNRSCGEAKQDRVDPGFIDPRKLPALPSLIRVGYDGKITADEAACAEADFDVGGVQMTIDILGLNVERLRLAREKRWHALSENWGKYHDDSDVMMAAACKELLPGEDGRLPRFFTTSRSYFARIGERILAEAPQAWI